MSKKAPPLVSVNLCCYNSERFLEETLQSVFCQSFTDWELVVVNDGSSDSTDTIIQTHLAKGRRITYHHQANSGLGASRNRAIELSSGEYIALIDHDDLWEPDKLARQVELMRSDEGIGLCYTDAVIVDAEGRPSGRYLPHSTLASGFVLPQLFLGDFIACSSVLISREAIRGAGLFQEGLKLAEEYDLFLRLASDYRFGLVDAPLLKLRVHGSNASWDYIRTQREIEPLLRRTLQEHPEIRRQLGWAAARIRLAGLGCTPEHVEALARPLEAIRALPSLRALASAAIRLAVSFLPQQILEFVLGVRGRLRQRAAA